METCGSGLQNPGIPTSPRPYCLHCTLSPLYHWTTFTLHHVPAVPTATRALLSILDHVLVSNHILMSAEPLSVHGGWSCSLFMVSCCHMIAVHDFQGA